MMEGPVRPQQKARADKTDSSSNAVKTPNSDFLAATARFQAARSRLQPCAVQLLDKLFSVASCVAYARPHTPCWVYHFHQSHHQKLSAEPKFLKK